MPTPDTPATNFLAPPLGYRIASTVSGGLIGVVGIVLLILEPEHLLILGIAFVAIGVFVAVRTARAGALLAPESLTIRGFVSSKRVPRKCITSIERFPSIDWEDDDGRSHQSTLTVFSGGGQTGLVASSRAQAKRALNVWLQS
jgi:hypothetical protein